MTELAEEKKTPLYRLGLLAEGFENEDLDLNILKRDLIAADLRWALQALRDGEKWEAGLRDEAEWLSEIVTGTTCVATKTKAATRLQTIRSAHMGEGQ